MGWLKSKIEEVKFFFNQAPVLCSCSYPLFGGRNKTLNNLFSVPEHPLSRSSLFTINKLLISKPTATCSPRPPAFPLTFGLSRERHDDPFIKHLTRRPVKMTGKKPPTNQRLLWRC